MNKAAVFLSVGLALSITLAPAARAETWLRISPTDPYMCHYFDSDSAQLDPRTGYVAAVLVCADPNQISSNTPGTRYLWAFDCARNEVFYVATQESGANWAVKDGWAAKAEPYTEQHMGGVTAALGGKLCASKSFLTKRALP